MSVTYCHYCDRHIDLDFDVEHFVTDRFPDGDEELKYCVQQEQDIEMEIEKKKREFEVEK